MTKLKIYEFKQGLFWYACCEIPAEEPEHLYCDNTPTVIMNGPTILHTRGLTNYRAMNKLLDKLEAYYTERKGERND